MNSDTQARSVSNAVWIESLAFAGMRRLNSFSFYGDQDAAWADWEKQRLVYRMGQVNVFAGRNGGGKSTVLEIIDLLRNPNRLCRLPRENRRSDQYCFLDIHFSNQSNLRGMAAPNEWKGIPRDENLEDPLFTQGVLLASTFQNSHGKFVAERFARNVSKRELAQQSKAALASMLGHLGCSVSYWNSSADIDPIHAVGILNRLAPLLSGLASDPRAPSLSLPFPTDHIKAKPVIQCRDDWFMLYHSDDLIQTNSVHIDNLPSGWKQIISILGHIESCSTGSVFILEEPEAHLHPHMQRALAKLLVEVANRKSLQVFMSTHSPTLQSRFTWDSSIEMKYFEVDADQMYEGISERRVLDSLGINGADQGLSNGVIWIEGPSDRIYLKHWMNLYCLEKRQAVPVEHVDYMFAYHGGALLARLTADSGGPDEIAINKINRNFVVVMDDDNDFETTGSIKPSTSAEGKRRVIDQISKINTLSCGVLVTPGFTIESSLPEEFRSLYFQWDIHSGRLRHLKGKKVAIAHRYVENYKNWADCCDPSASIEELIRDLLSMVERWRGPVVFT